MEEKIRLKLLGITYNQIESGVYALILEDEASQRRIPIVIGLPEAQAIECKLQEVATPRPLTHDTMVATLAAFNIHLKEVFIRKTETGAFAADLIFTDGTTTRVIDSRSSDAIALAIRVGAPIYTSEQILIEDGFDAKEHPSRTSAQDITTMKPPKNSLASKSDAELIEEMQKAVDNEDYEYAAKIKAELDRRNDEQTC